MQYTLAQAVREIATTTHAYGGTDAKEAVNRAIQALAGMSGWECLRRVVRLFSAQPLFALPQGCAGLVRACVAGKPVSVRGQDFQFLHSGPGDMSRPPAGFCPVLDANILDRGFSPLLTDPMPPFALFAVSTGLSEPDVSVKGLAPDGRVVRETLRVWDAGTDAGTVDFGPVQEFTEVREVVLDAAAAHYVDLWCRDADGNRYRVASCHPDVKVPYFHRYELKGAPPRGFELLAEVRLDPLPLVEDSDVVPFDSLQPLEWMEQMRWYTKSGEFEAAQKVAQLAVQWLKARETTAAKVQTAVISNSLYRGSLGELSMEAVNI